jgi:hypothetical protein
MRRSLLGVTRNGQGARNFNLVDNSMEDTMMTKEGVTQVGPDPGGTPAPAGAPAENPLEASITAVSRGGANLYGAFSLQQFCDVGSLSQTHADADGFLAYVRQFNAPNYWYKDAGVKVWAYGDPYDEWQDTYGTDAVRVFYHSGHGGMDANGVFYAPMGAAWAGNDCTAISSNMNSLGDHYGRYVFWSTCLSCRVLDGNSPIRTWGAVNRGFRMLFGFETTSVDDPNYGKNFWNHWRTGKSFSQAWLDASWDISHSQAPSVTACGATADEAKNRVFNERFFYPDQVRTDWWWWRWYYAARDARAPQRQVPPSILLAKLQPVDPRSQSARALASKFGIDVAVGDAPRAEDNSFRIVQGDQRIACSAEGAIHVQLATPNLLNYSPIDERRASSLAREAIGRYGLDQNVSLVFDRTMLSREAGGTAQGAGRLEGPYTTGTIVQFRQVINGLPVLNPERGVVRIAFDNDGTPTHVYSSLYPVDALIERPGEEGPTPPPPGGIVMPERGPEPGGYEQGLSTEFRKRLAAWAISGFAPVSYATVPDSMEVGYEIQGSEAVMVARSLVEVNFGNGYRKLYWVSSPL